VEKANTEPMVTAIPFQKARRQGLRILLAEDNLSIQKLTVIILQKAGFSVDAVKMDSQAVDK